MGKKYSVLIAANKYYSSASHHEQKDQKTTDQIKSLAVTVKPAWKLQQYYI